MITLLHGVEHELIEHLGHNIWIICRVLRLKILKQVTLIIQATLSILMFVRVFKRFLTLVNSLLAYLKRVMFIHILLLLFIVLALVSICKINFLNWYFIGTRFVFFFCIGLTDEFNTFNWIMDFLLDLHKDNLLSIWSESIILFTKTKKTTFVGFLHLCKIAGLVVTFVNWSIFNRNYHPTLQTYSWLKRSNFWVLGDPQFFE